MAELPDAKKWFTGFIDITRWLKDGGTLIRIIVLLILAFLLYTGIKQVSGIFSRPRELPQISNITGGKINVDNTQDKKTKIGVFNLW